MKYISSNIEGVFEIQNFIAKDSRGVFVKTFHTENFKEIGFSGVFAESYYSQSIKGVVRGMHFQTPPFDHEKLVYVTEGSILDVIVDLRRESSTFGNFATFHLNEFSSSVFIPKGCAHGFLTLSVTATVVYNVTTVYNNKHDLGIRWDSFGFDWPVVTPIVSTRDMSFALLEEFQSPF